MFSIHKNKSKNFVLFFRDTYFLFALIIFFGVFFFIHNASAAESGIVSKITDFVGRGVSGIAQGMAAPFLWVFNILLYAVFTVLGLLLTLGGVLLNWAIDPNNFTIVANNGAVYESWTFVRDILNIFFIFFLLFAAFATVFQIDKYNYKKIVLQLVIMALLVNFSFPITRFIIDVSNVFFYGIFSLGGFKGGGLSSSMADAFHIAKIAIPSTTFFEAGFHASTLTAKLILSNLFLIQVALQFLIIGALFVIRIAVLTILIIFSPVGFVAGIFPGTKQFSDQWWSALFNQSFFAPVMALVLVIALKVITFMNSQGTLQKSIDTAVRANAAASDYSSLIVGGMTILIPLIIIWVGMISAQKFGAIGADIVMKYATAGMKWVAKTPLLWTGRKYEKWATTRESKLGQVTKWLAPTAVYKGYEEWRKYSHEKDRSPVAQAGAEMADAFNRLGKDHTDLAFKNYAGNISKEQKDIAAVSTNSDYVIHELINAINAEDDEKTIGALQILASQNDFNDLMTAMVRIQAETGKKFGLEGKVDALPEMSSEGTKEALKQMMLQTGTSPELAAKAMLNLSNTAIAAGNVGMAGAANFKIDEKTQKGEFVISSEKDQAYVAAVKLQNMETQARQRTLHHNAIFKETALEDVVVKDENGNDETIQISMGDINGVVGEKVLGTFTNADINQAERSRDDFKREITNRMRALKTDVGQVKLAKMQEQMNKNPIVKEYFERVYAMTTGYDYNSGTKVDSKTYKPTGEGKSGGADFATLAAKSKQS